MAAKEYKKAPSQPLAELVKRTGMSYTEISKIIGVSPNAIGRWISEGQMPAMMTLAVEALFKRKVNPDEETVVVTVLSGTRVIDSRAVSSPGRMTINGQSYLLIPTKAV